MSCYYELSCSLCYSCSSLLPTASLHCPLASHPCPTPTAQVLSLIESGLPPSFKGEAVAAYIHIWNRLPTTASYDPSKTPYELWHKRKPEVGHLRVWGCTAYVHVQKDKRTGIGAYMEKCLFIGYPIGFKGWKFYNPTTRKVVISERAEFDERFFPGLKSNANTPSMPSLVPAVDTPPAPYVDDAEDEYPVWPIPPKAVPAAPVASGNRPASPISVSSDSESDSSSDAGSSPGPSRMPLPPSPVRDRRPARDASPPERPVSA